MQLGSSCRSFERLRGGAAAKCSDFWPRAGSHTSDYAHLQSKCVDWQRPNASRPYALLFIGENRLSYPSPWLGPGPLPRFVTALGAWRHCAAQRSAIKKFRMAHETNAVQVMPSKLCNLHHGGPKCTYVALPSSVIAIRRQRRYNMQSKCFPDC